MSKNYYSNLTWLILNVDVGSVVKSENGASHNRHNAVNRTLFLLHVLQNWDNTTFLIMSFGNLKPRWIITKSLCFFTIFFVVIETSVTVTYIFWSSSSSLQVYVHYEWMIFGDKQLLKGDYFVSFLSTSPYCNGQTQVGKQKLARLIESRKYLAKLLSFTPQIGSGMFMFLEYITIEYDCTKRIYVTLM